MLRLDKIQNELLHLIGWSPNLDGSSIQIDEDLTKSESGLYFQQAHPLITLENLASIAPSFNGSEPELFSKWLEMKTRASISKAITRFYSEKITEGTYNPLCEDKVLFTGTGRLVDTVKNKKNIVGFELTSLRTKGVTLKINRIGLHFTKPGTYTLYFLHSSSEAPLQKIDLEVSVGNKFEWFNTPNLYLPSSGQESEVDIGGSWYICYSQSKLPEGSQAIRKNKDWSKGPCSACSQADYLSWQAWSKYLEVHPFYVSEASTDFGASFNNDFSTDDVAPVKLWDISKNQYTYDNNYGLNLDISVVCDLTDFILDQKWIFRDIIMKQVAVDILREFAYNANVRTNRHSINASRVDILYALDGDEAAIRRSGLSYELDLAIKAAKLNTSGLDRACLPCKNNGIKYRSV